jgi:hypothetical protein
MISFKEYENIAELYSTVEEALDKVGEDRDISIGEIMCVFTNLLTTAAVESHMKKREFMQSVEVLYDVKKVEMEDSSTLH